MDLRTTLLNLLDRAYQEEQAFVEGLSDEERSTVGTLEQWSAKDVIAHIAAWKERMARNLAAVARGEPVSRVDDYDQVNAEIFEEYHERPWAEVLEHSERAYRILVKRTGAMGNEDLAGTETLPWQEGRPLWRLIVGNSYSHPISHLGQYYAARGEVSQATAMQEEATVLLAQLDESPSWIGVVRYNLACHYALIGQKEKAIEELRRALDLNPGLTEWSKEDPDFASIRGEPGYQQLYRE